MTDTKNTPLLILSGVILAIVVVSIIYVLNANRDNAEAPEVNQVADTPQEPKPETVPNEERTEQPLPGDATVLEGVEKYPVGTFEGMTTQEVVNRMNTDSSSLPGEVTILKGTEKYEAGWTDGLTKQQILDRMNKEVDQQNKADGAILLEGSDIQTSP